MTAPATVLMPAWLEIVDPPGLRVATWDTGEPTPSQELLDEVVYFVPPYMCGMEDVALGARMPRLQVVQALMAGVDGMAAVLPAHVQLRRAVGVHDTSTAELAVGLIIAALRGIDVAARDMLHERWDHVRRPSLADSRVAILGWGGVGRSIAARLSAFEVTVTAFSRTGTAGSQPVERFLASPADYDVVVLAVPHSPGAGPLMDAQVMAGLAEGCLIVNVGRGALVDTDALVEELRAGRLRAALDVTDPEPLPPGHPLWSCPGLLVTPHLGGDSEAFVPRARAMVQRELAHFAAGFSG